MNRIKITSAVLGLAMFVSVAAPAQAQTIADLQAQIQMLMAQLAALQGGTTTSTGVAFTSNLTVGSTGAEVTALQQMLVAQGHLTMPAGVAFGYFGPLTRSALASWQAANGVSPAVGYWGPISRARAAALGHAGGTTTGGTVTGGTTVTGTITTPGVEGILTATLAPLPSAGVKLEEGDNRKAILGVELEAKLSDVRVERIKVKIDQASGGTADRDLYRRIADMIYVMDGSTVLASASLNSNTVVEETSGNYYITITGLNHVISKDSKKTLTIALDAQSSWDSDFDNDTWTLTIESNGIRGVDGAGINLFAPTSGSLARTFTSVPGSIADASGIISLHADSPKAALVIAASSSTKDEKAGVELMKFNVKAEDDNIEITDAVVTLTRGGANTATATTAYLYDGSTLVGSATVVGTSATAMTATFDNISVDVAKDATKALTVKVDIVDATGAVTTLSASAVTLTAENSIGDAASVTGSAAGKTMSILNVGPELTLNSKSITKSGNDTNSSAQANFQIAVKAVGGNVVASTTGAFLFDLFENNVSTTTINGVYSTPTGATVDGTNITIAEGNTVVFSVDVLTSLAVSGNTAKLYAFGMDTVKMNNIDFTHLNDELSWRTSTVTLP